MGKKALPLYGMLKKGDKFYWTDEAKEAFADLKKLLQSNQLLAFLTQSEPKLLYISATTQVVSVVIAVERDTAGKAQQVQHLVYYISEVLTSSKTRYPHYQKITYGMSMAAQKL